MLYDGRDDLGGEGVRHFRTSSGFVMNGIRVKKISAEKEIQKAFSIRLRVFVKEQGVARAIELDDDDRIAAHFLAYLKKRPVGTARVVVKQERAKIGRMAVLKSYRGKGVGKKLLTQALQWARRRKARSIYLHAQLPVAGFYAKFGFRPIGPVFDEAGILHRKMICRR